MYDKLWSSWEAQTASHGPTMTDQAQLDHRVNPPTTKSAHVAFSPPVSPVEHLSVTGSVQSNNLPRDDRSGTSEVSTLLNPNMKVRMRNTASARYRATLTRFENYIACDSIVKGVGGVKLMKNFLIAIQSVRIIPYGTHSAHQRMVPPGLPSNHPNGIKGNESSSHSSANINVTGGGSVATNSVSCHVTGGPTRKNRGGLIALVLTRRKRTKVYLLSDLLKVDASRDNLRMLQSAGYGTAAAWEQIPLSQLQAKTVVCYFKNHTMPLSLIFEKAEEAVNLVELLALLLKKYRKDDYALVDFYVDCLDPKDVSPSPSDTVLTYPPDDAATCTGQPTVLVV
eukprot:Blabericola_migrator_1__11443@NODE_67_length_15652_cov_76_134937_g60_i0_p6_GENE_NODE_67_length_15652_cov_76_134937_g60_i0NODE_67_length_15652_cov_76_134937_g60_i0_p6_ORF_typecomplete_len339_score31_25_NODE_67_length_15652_cov_76_134937_g60_i01069811714